MTCSTGLTPRRGAEKEVGTEGLRSAQFPENEVERRWETLGDVERR